MSSSSTNSTTPDNPSQAPSDAEPLPGGIQQVLALFEGELAGVEFPEVGAQALASAVEERQARANELAAARAAAAAAESAMAESTQGLQRLAERAVAYAKVYAADNPELAAQLADIKLDTGRRAAKRGRKPKLSTPEAAESSEAAEPSAARRKGKAARTPSSKRSAAGDQGGVVAKECASRES
jgi:hypothetical protein